MATGIVGNKNFTAISDTLDSLGYTPIQKAGIISRFNAESSLSPKAINPNDGGKGKNSVGLGQWNNERADGLTAFVKKHGGDVNDVVTQTKYFDYDLKTNEPTAYAAMKSARTPADASAAMMHYERPSGYTSTNPAGGMAWGKTVKGAEEVAGHFGVWTGGDNSDTYGVGGLTSLTDGPKVQETVTNTPNSTATGQDPVSALFSSLDKIGNPTATGSAPSSGLGGVLSMLTGGKAAAEKTKLAAPKVDMTMPTINFAGLI